MVFPVIRVFPVNLGTALFTVKNRQEPTRTVKSRKEAFLCIFRAKYYLLDPIHALYIQISLRIARAAPQNKEITILQIALLTDKKFYEVVLVVYGWLSQGR